VVDDSKRAPVKITRVRSFYRENQQATRSWQRQFWQFGVELETDTGLKGIGFWGAGLAGVTVARHALAPIVLGRDPAEVESLWEEMYAATLPYGRRGVALMAMSAIDLALWDLVGQATGRPVWRCLRDWTPPAVKAYATTSNVASCRRLGFAAFKLPISLGPTAGAEGMKQIEAEVARARAAAGDKASLMVDCWMGWNVAYTEHMAERLAPFRIDWIEEPLPPDDRTGYEKLHASVRSTRIATGEHEYGWHGYEEHPCTARTALRFSAGTSACFSTFAQCHENPRWSSAGFAALKGTGSLVAPYLLMQYKWVAVRRKISPSANAGVLSV
jgi:L-rhamnonate dehydratase